MKNLLALTAALTIAFAGVSFAGDSHRKDRDVRDRQTTDYGHDRNRTKTNAEKKEDGEKWFCTGVPTRGCERPSRREKPWFCGNVPTPGCEG